MAHGTRRHVVIVRRRVGLIQHKREAYWFYRFLSLGYDRWVNPLFWTPPMRSRALAHGRPPSSPAALGLPRGHGQGLAADEPLEAADDRP